MRRNASTYADVLAGEAAFAHGDAARFEDMKHIASVIENRARALGVPVEDVFSRRSEFNAYGTRLPAGIGEKHLNMAERAIREVRQNGPVTTATFYATPAAKGNLPRGLEKVGQTKGHVYFTDPQKRAINTRAGTKRANYDAITSAPLAPLTNTRADQRLANAWGYQDPNVTRGLTTPRNTPTPTLRQPTLDGVQVARGLPAPTTAPRGTMVADAPRGIMLSSAAPNTFTTAYAPEPTRVGAVAAMPVASQQYDLPATPTARSTVQGRAGIPTPMQAPRDAMPAARSARVGPGLPDQRVAQAFQDATKFVDLNQRSPSRLYDPNAMQPATRVATPTPAPRLAAPIQAGFSPVAQPSFTPERLAGFPTPTQRGTPVARPAVGSFAPAMPEPVAAPTFASVTRPSVPVPSRAPRMQGPTLPAAPVAAPAPSAAPRTAAAAIETVAPRQVTPAAPAVTPYSASRTAAPAAPTAAAPAAPAEVTPYSATQSRVGGLGGLGGYMPGIIGGAIGGAVLGPVGAIAGSYLANKAFGGGPTRAAGNGVTTGLITGRAIPAAVLRDPARYGQGGFTGLGLPDAPRAPSQSAALRDRDRRGGRGDSGPAMSKSASDAIGKAGAGRGGLY